MASHWKTRGLWTHSCFQQQVAKNKPEVRTQAAPASPESQAGLRGWAASYPVAEGWPL
jgi:hypothetical protein